MQDRSLIIVCSLMYFISASMGFYDEVITHEDVTYRGIAYLFLLIAHILIVLIVALSKRSNSNH